MGDRSAGLRRILRMPLDLFSMGISMLWLAPAVLAIVAVPEFIQHVVEIRLGMFESDAAFRASQLDQTRMVFGFAKIAGLLLTFLAAARFWWTRRHGGRWWDVRQISWPRFLLGAALFFGVGSAPELLNGVISKPAYQIVGAVWTILLLPALFLMLAGLFADRATPFATLWLRAWPWLALIAALVVLGYAPASWLHLQNHLWASGAAEPLIWALMVWDSLVVGLLAGLTGTALFLGYEAFRVYADSRAQEPDAEPGAWRKRKR